MKRIYHPWWDWECLKMYESYCEETSGQSIKMYAEFLKDLPRFEKALQRVLKEWPISCEQFLSNESMNRIAWLGQASLCIETGIPCFYRGGFKIMSEEEQHLADKMALKYLRIWINDKKQDNQIYLFMEESRL